MSRAVILFFALAQLLPAMAAEILSAQIRFHPQRPFVNQYFEMLVEVRVTPGAELQETQIDGLPDSSVAVFDGLMSRERRQVRENGQVVDILSFASRGRGLKPISLPVRCALRATLVERRSAGFFSQWVSMPRALGFAPATLEIRPLPAAGQPEGYGGAVGRFTLIGAARPRQVQPGDLVTLSWELSGSGWLGDAALRLPDPGGAFKLYPPQETARDPARGHLAVRQVAIPLATNATRVGEAFFPYFDPDEEIYRNATVGPFALVFGAAHSATNAGERRIEIANPSLPSETALPGDVFAARVQSVRRGWPLAVSIVAAVLAACALARRGRWLAVLAAALILGIGMGWQRQVARRQVNASWVTTANVAARLCPSEGARALFDLAGGHAVTPLETADGWVRVLAEGREGWVPSGLLSCGAKPTGELP